MEFLNVNPVLAKEVKVKMRSWKIVAMLSVYLGILALVAVFIVVVTLQEYSVQASSSVTKTVYVVIAVIQFLLLVFIAPALTSGTISGERERQTLELLLCTKLSPRSIIIGKLTAAISQIILLIVSSLPIFSVVFLFGGISAGNVIQLVLFYLEVAFLMGSIGIFTSTFIKRTTTANVVTYGIVLFLLFGTSLISLFYVLINSRNNNSLLNKTALISYINPLSGFISLIADQLGVSSSGSFSIPGVYSVPGQNVVNNIYNLPFWIKNGIVDLGISIALIEITIKKLNPIKKGK